MGLFGRKIKANNRLLLFILLESESPGTSSAEGFQIQLSFQHQEKTSMSVAVGLSPPLVVPYMYTEINKLKHPSVCIEVADTEVNDTVNDDSI